MNLAITLLVGVALASVIGTILKQNQPYQDYLIKFGPFWHEVFRTLGLYDVYTSGWFLFILAFLVVSTSTCLWRNTPRMLRTMRDYQEAMHRHSLERLKARAQWRTTAEIDQTCAAVGQVLEGSGYRVRLRRDRGELRIAAMKGAANRLGYLFTHAAIVVICLGGLADGNLPLKLQTLFGRLSIETRDLPLSAVPRESWLPVNNTSFRANVSIPEGGRAQAAFINVSEGYFVQPLPFAIELKDFRIAHYPTGQPKSFASDVRITAADLPAPLERTIEVNHPLVWRGYTLYQSGFGDGGSKLTLEAIALDGGTPIAPFAARVNETLPLAAGAETLQLELTDFRTFNINAVSEQEAENGDRFRNFGPSFTFKLRAANGTAREYVNYMLPVPIDGRQYLLSGVRGTPAEEFRYLHIPVDPEGGPGRFQRFVAALHDPQTIEAIAPRVVGQAVSGDTGLQADLRQAVVRLTELFNSGGFDAVVSFVETAVPETHRDAAREAYLKMLQLTLREIYLDLLTREGALVNGEPSEEDARFFDDLVAAATALPLYGAPRYLKLTDFTQVEASVLQITRSPGKNVVYFGFALLIAGVFLMFYVPHERVWAVLRYEAGASVHLLLAGRRLRHERDFAADFHKLCRQVEAALASIQTR